MPSLLAATCAHCTAEIADDALSCASCGAAAVVTTLSEQVPLILPGSPALSADLHRKKRSLIPAAGAGILAFVVAGIAIWKMPEAGEDVLPRISAASGPRTAETNSSVRDADAAVIARDAEREYALADSLAAASRAELTNSNSSSATRSDSLATAPAGAPPEIARSRASASALPVSPPPGLPAPTVASRPAPPSADRTGAMANAESGDRMRSPSLQVAPLVANSIRMGERVRLRWSIRTAPGSRTPQRAEFTSADATIASVDPRSGVITARAPGRTWIIVDAGAAGRKVVTLDVRGPAASPVVTIPSTARVVAGRAVLVTPRSIAAQQVASSSAVQTTAPRPVAPATLRRDSAAARVASAVPAPSAVASAPAPTPAVPETEAALIDLPTATEVRGVAERFVASVRGGGVRNFDVVEFLENGADHRVTLASTPLTTSATAFSVRVTFAMRLTKYDGGGRPVTRIAPVTMDVDKRERVLRASAVTIGAMRRP